ncbi:UNVERIFIED_CONTAM: hypothetical protein GTU68_006303, partial [Idotea baltica]|nr:hypothetical protein [Idotea baltica]
MVKHIEIGNKGEDKAVEFLISKGFEILERNWRYSKAEIDIIAKDEYGLVFVEVKTRSSLDFGKPEEFVSSHQEELIFGAAQRYMEKVNYDWEIRFDIIAILIK